MNRYISRVTAPTLLALALALLAGGCVGSTGRPDTPPSIVGTISQLLPTDARDVVGGFLIDDGQTGYDFDKASVTVTDGTRIVGPEGDSGTFADLANGQRVEVWFEGPVAESYPVQATAGEIRVMP
jgi:hypothetical protein